MKCLTEITLRNYRRITLPFVLLMLLAGCQAQGDEEFAVMPPPPEVDVAEVIHEPVIIWRRFTGRVAAPETVDLRPRVSGYIDEVAFEEGALVEAGDLLFQIDPRPYKARQQAARAELALTQSQLQLAKSEAVRAETLLQNRAISREEYDQRSAALISAQARVEVAQATLLVADLDLQYTRIIAPVSGRVGRALATRGNLANAAQTLLTTLVSVNPVHVYFEADDKSGFSSQRLLAEGGSRAVRITLGNDENHRFHGELDFVDNQLNSGTGTLQYRAVLDNAQGLIKPGQFARVEMPVAALDAALMISRKAILTDQDRRYVYLVDEHNRVVPRQVTTGDQVDDLLVITEGLNKGDLVIVNGIQRVFAPGMEVSPNRVAMREASPDTLARSVELSQ